MRTAGLVTQALPLGLSKGEGVAPKVRRMKILNCPLNGPRNISEFVWGGEVKEMPDPAGCSDRRVVSPAGLFFGGWGHPRTGPPPLDVLLTAGAPKGQAVVLLAVIYRVWRAHATRAAETATASVDSRVGDRTEACLGTPADRRSLARVSVISGSSAGATTFESDSNQKPMPMPLARPRSHLRLMVAPATLTP